ncbi:MAG: PrsW family intramembrane metalloprotease, partial [Streptomyces sp.]|nr:PrsW family intramembrane metalloprotease [Streptomyces sp.]
YAAYATHLAFLRAAAARGRKPADYGARESELLQHLWHHRRLAQPALLHCTPLPWPPPPGAFPAPRPYASWPPQQPYAAAPAWGPPKHL